MSRVFQWFGVALAASALLTGCSPRLFLVNQVADQWAGQSTAQEEDLVLAREASAFHLKFSESLLQQTPGHIALAQAVASGFTQYAYAFVAFEAEKLETQDAKLAKRLRERAARLYWRAHQHARRALEMHRPQLFRQLRELNQSVPPPQEFPLRPEDIGLAYWAAASWAAHISLSKDRPDVVADLPQAQALATLAWRLDPSYGEGALASLMGTLEASRPGGSPGKAADYFDQGLKMAGERNAAIHVAMAETLALPSGDRKRFEALLKKAIEISDKVPTLGNQVMKDRAQWLLDTADERF